MNAAAGRDELGPKRVVVCGGGDLWAQGPRAAAQFEGFEKKVKYQSKTQKKLNRIYQKN